ncbi:MAG: VWA domain-containing protein [Candidatus Aminicenantaceae bacterium]
MRKKIFLLIILFTFIFQPNLCNLNSETNQEKEDQEALLHEVTVTLKLVQVYVMDKREKPVTGLVKDDFLLFDNGEIKKITEFEKHMLIKPPKKVEEKIEETRPAAPRKITLKMNRKFFFIFDYPRNDLEGIIKSKKAALYFIDSQILPTDEIGVFSYSLVRGLVLHEYLTTNHHKVREVIQGIKDVPGGVGIPMYELEAVTKVSEDFPNTRTWIIEDGKLEGSARRLMSYDFVQDIKKLAQSLWHIPGYKNIIFFSAGLARSLLYDKGSSLLRDEYKEMCIELASSSCPVYSVNTEGALARLSQFAKGGSRGEDSLMQLSKLSGGKYFGNVNSYKSVVEDIQDITANYYVLGYYIDEKWDGEYHRIKVKVKRKGYKVYAQQGYFNPKPFSKLSDFEKQVHLIGLALSKKSYFQEPLNFPLITLPCSNKKESNTVLLSEIDVERIKEVIKQKTEITTLILDTQNALVELIKGEMDFSTIPQKKIHHYTITSLVPSHYEYQVVLRNLKTGKAAVASSSVVIPEVSDSGFRLYPPLLLIPEKETYYLFSKNKEKETKSEILSLKEIYPFISTRNSPLIEEIDHGVPKLFAVVRCSISDIPEPEIELSAYLTQLSSGQKTSLSSSILSSKTESEEIDVLLIEFQLPELEAGEYSLYLVGEEINTKSESQTTRTFRVR